MNKELTVVVSDTMHDKGTSMLKKKCNVLFPKTEEDFLSDIKNADAIILIRNGNAFKNTIDKASKLKVIAKHGVGLDKIDLAYAKQKGIQVIYTPDSNSISVAEHFITLALMLAKKMKKGELVNRNAEWKSEPFDFLGIDLFGKTLGIMGFGNVGRQIARIGKNGFNMNILYYDLENYSSKEQQFNASKVSLDTLFKESDFISINLPLTEKTKGLVNSDLLQTMKPTSFIINVARGPIWKEADLYKALVNNWISGAASDVFEAEPIQKDNPLLTLENFIGTPHNAGHTEESMEKASVMIAEDILSIFDGKEPKRPVFHS